MVIVAVGSIPRKFADNLEKLGIRFYLQTIQKFCFISHSTHAEESSLLHTAVHKKKLMCLKL